MTRNIITSPATRRELLETIRNIRRLTKRAQAGLIEGGDQRPTLERLERVLNHCAKAKRQLEPWKYRTWKETAP